MILMMRRKVDTLFFLYHDIGGPFSRICLEPSQAKRQLLMLAIAKPELISAQKKLQRSTVRFLIRPVLRLVFVPSFLSLRGIRRRSCRNTIVMFSYQDFNDL